jgi:transposase
VHLIDIDIILFCRFREQGLPKHWLPPSLMPLLEVLIFERKNWAEEQQRQNTKMADALAKAEGEIAKLQAELERRPHADVPKISLPLKSTFMHQRSLL